MTGPSRFKRERKADRVLAPANRWRETIDTIRNPCVMFARRIIFDQKYIGNQYVTNTISFSNVEKR
jgi:hypothetical protein